ncbi:MAG: matrixin family metalloprotease [Nanoarchaeota archaeon]|nr:matrixin family metalloprotease [Nanoarchaeota archaeon]
MNKIKPINFLIIFLIGISIFFIIDSKKVIGNLPDASPDPNTEDDIIIIPLSLHLINGSSETYNTNRNEENIIELVRNANIIWDQANILFILEDIDTIEIKGSDINLIFSSGVGILTKRDDFDSGMINGYFMNSLNSNGISFPPQGVFAVADKTTVNDYRTLAHELGHLLGLAHVKERENLMFSGVNGEILSDEEIIFARRNAKRVFNINNFN